MLAKKAFVMYSRVLPTCCGLEAYQTFKDYL